MFKKINKNLVWLWWLSLALNSIFALIAVGPLWPLNIMAALASAYVLYFHYY